MGADLVTPEGRQDLAAVIAEMQELGDRLAYQGEDALAIRVVRWADRLALLLAEAPLQQVQEQEHTEVARVDAMGDSQDNPTASEHETTPATVSLNQVSHEPQAWSDIASAPKDGTRVLAWLGPDFVVCIVRWGHEVSEDDDDEGDEIPGQIAWIDDELFAPDPQPTHWMPLPAAPLARAQQESE